MAAESTIDEAERNIKVTRIELAKLAGVSLRTVDRWCLRDNLPYHFEPTPRARPHVVIRLSDFRQWAARIGVAIGIPNKSEADHEA